ncbi:MAG: ornithine carbamoyltransferase [bacterium]
MAKLRNEDLIAISDLSREEVQMILNLAKFIKNRAKKGQTPKLLKGKTLAMIFDKPSNRTRVSFEVGMWQLGGLAIELDTIGIRFAKGESIPDIARTLSRYVDGVVMRTSAHESIIEFARYASVPVINGLTDLLHPCQALSDIFTIWEKKGKLRGVKVAYIGDGNNVCHSLMTAAAKMGMEFIAACPEGYEPNKNILEMVQGIAKKSKATIGVIHDPNDAVTGADVIYTDVWVSMGQEGEEAKRLKAFKKFQVNFDLVNKAKKDVIVMHCLPAHRGQEITSDVMVSKYSAVFDQAENRLHVQKAILTLLMED